MMSFRLKSFVSTGTDIGRDTGIFGGGQNNIATNIKEEIDYVTISSTGNASSFGNLTMARLFLSSCSNSTL